MADYIAAASHSSRATHAQTVSGALLCDSVAFVLARAGSGERCWRCSSLSQLFCAQFRFVGQRHLADMKYKIVIIRLLWLLPYNRFFMRVRNLCDFPLFGALLINANFIYAALVTVYNKDHV